MRTFIQEVLQEIIQKKLDFESLIFILPSKRAGSFLRKTLSSTLSTTIFAPKIYSIEEFVKEISGLQSVSPVDLLFRFYKVYLEITPNDEREPFESFIGWAPMLLDDINEIDRHLLNHLDIFNHLNAIQELNHWSNTAPTDLISNYLSFWNKLSLYYTSLCDSLVTTNEGHQGLQYRKASEEITFYLNSNKDRYHVFLGFNALNTAEDHIIREVLASGNSSIYWDADNHFMTSKNHDASLFLKKHKEHWKHFRNEPFKIIAHNYSKPKNINSTAVPQNIDQVKYIAHILGTYDTDSLNKTAVVLGDESLIIPLLNSLPGIVENVNITMGLPLNQTPVSSFFENLFSLHLNFSDKGFYYKELLGLLKQPLSIQIFDPLSLDLLSSTIIRDNAIYTSPEKALSILGKSESLDILQSVLKDWNNNPMFAVTNTLLLIQKILHKLSYKQDSLLVQYLIGFQRAFNTLHNLLSSYSYITDLKVLFRLYKDTVSKETIDLKGNPHEGLQIMGMLESRLLDFENVIITSVNEGVLPSGKSPSSFIPYDIKKHYGLPTYSDKDAVYTYHFYRLLHRAKNIHILYTTSNSGLGSTEKSRLLLQLELDRIHKVHCQTAAPAILNSTSFNKSIIKSPSVQQKIKQFLVSGISPSAIGTYLRNPLEFYYQYILGIRSQDTLEETIAANTMGTIIHNVLEALYIPHINKEVVKSDLEKMIQTLQQYVDIEFKSSKIKEYATGKNHIIYKVICRFIENFIKSEIRALDKGAILFIKSLENKLKTPLNHPSLPYPVTLKGTVDRVDRYNDQLRIIDYKTGTVNPGDLKIKDWQDLLLAEGKYEKAFQVLLYTYMITTTQSTSLPAQAGIISTKKIKNGFMPFTLIKDQFITQDTLASFESILIQLLQEIINPEIPFRDSGFTY